MFRSLYLLAAVMLVTALWCPVMADTIVFQDDFNRVDNTEPGGPAGQPWALDGTRTADSIHSNLLRVIGTGFSGRGWCYQDVSNFASPYEAVLSANGDKVVWSVDMKVTANPSGYGTHGIAGAFVLGSTTSEVTTGDGYAVIYDKDNNDALTLASYTGGLDSNSNFTPLIAWDSGDPLDVFNVCVSYDPSDNTWEMLADVSSFTEPVVASTSRGTVVDSSYTGVAMGYMGLFANHNASHYGGNYDNVSVAVVPEPATMSMLALGAIALLGRKRK